MFGLYSYDINFQATPSQSAVEWVPDEFHERLSIQTFDSIAEVEQFYTDHYHILTGNYGVLKFMYTVLLTKVSLGFDISSGRNRMSNSKMERKFVSLTFGYVTMN